MPLRREYSSGRRDERGLDAVTAVTARLQPPPPSLVLHAQQSPFSIVGWKMTDKKDMATEGAADRIKGSAKQVEGRVRNAVGGLSGDNSEQVKGKAQELKGKAQDALGKAKQRADPNPGVDDA
jgi:uncharacterized protein YjbJ (UPF0337 family)